MLSLLTIHSRSIGLLERLRVPLAHNSVNHSFDSYLYAAVIIFIYLYVYFCMLPLTLPAAGP